MRSPFFSSKNPPCEFDSLCGSYNDHEIHHYLPIPDDVFRCGFYITSLGHSAIPSQTPYPPVQHPALYHFEWQEGRILPEFALNLISRGEGIFESREAGEVAVSSGMAMLIPPGMWHRYRPAVETGWTETWMQFNGDFPHLLLKQGIISSHQAVFKNGNFIELEAKIRDLLAHVHASPAVNTSLVSLHGLNALALALPIQSRSDVPGADRKASDPLVSAAIDYIWSRSHQVLSVVNVADALGVTRRTLERRMMEVTGRTALDAIIDCRFSRAERLLRETNVPIKVIASLAGFGSLQNLRHVFLQRASCAPGCYRDRHRSATGGIVPR